MKSYLQQLDYQEESEGLYIIALYPYLSDNLEYTQFKLRR